MSKMQHIKFLISFLTVIFLTIPLTCSTIPSEEGIKDPYHKLFQIEFSRISDIYKDENIPGFEIFLQAKENATQFPYHSYTKLIRCYLMLLLNNTQGLMKLMDNKSISESLLNKAQSNLSEINKKMSNIIPTTIACAEWLSLAEQDIKKAEMLISEAKMGYTREEYSNVIYQLIIADSLLEKARALINISEIRNNITSLKPSRIEEIMKVVSSEWIKVVESIIDHYSIITGKPLWSSKNLLNQAKEYYANSSYYQALMKAAEAKAMVEYICNTPQFTNRLVALKSCETIIEYANLTMSKVYNESTIDAPLAEENFELAKLHLRDAEYEESEEGSKTIAALAIEESMIAKEQALAALDLKNAVEHGIKEEETFVSNNRIPWQHIMVSIIILEGFFIIFLLFMRRRK